MTWRTPANDDERPRKASSATKSVTRFGRSHKRNGFGFMADQVPKTGLFPRLRAPLPYELWKVSQVVRCNSVRTRADVLLTLNGDDLDSRPAVPLAVVGLDNG